MDYQAEGILVTLERQDLKKARVLIPRAEVARELLPDKLRERGAHVEVVPVYRTLVPSEDGEGWRRQLVDHQIHVVTFTSSSTVRNFVEMLAS